ncbi:hypothetical protein, partial [Stenotrophomonas sp. SrG]|uniref:hypothetical protein n=1 Tax=Stenotrophomonas sp. SrG TaxID=3414430 RepID=UPI003CF716FE
HITGIVCISRQTSFRLNMSPHKTSKPKQDILELLMGGVTHTTIALRLTLLIKGKRLIRAEEVLNA